jgi:cell division protein FtsI/penicillin-binding protein 2
MNILGKIFVFAVFIMSIVFMSFAIAIFSSHTNWQKESQRLEEELAKNKEARNKLDTEITSLEQKIAASEASRDQVVAKLRAAIEEKDKELTDLKSERAQKLDTLEKEINALADAKKARQAAEENVARLRKDVSDLQTQLNEKVDRAAELAAKLHEEESFLAIAQERKAQLEKQVANARALLESHGLSVDSPPRDFIPDVDGVITAVVQDAVELSIGADDGLREGHELQVFRSDRYLGKVRVVSVKPDRAIARVVKDFSRGIIQRGDRVDARL